MDLSTAQPAANLPPSNKSTPASAKTVCRSSEKCELRLELYAAPDAHASLTEQVTEVRRMLYRFMQSLNAGLADT